MSSSAFEAGKRAAQTSASAGTPLKTAQDSGFSGSSSAYNAGVQAGKKEISQNKGK